MALDSKRVMSRPRTAVASSWRACAMAEGEEPFPASAYPAPVGHLGWHWTLSVSSSTNWSPMMALDSKRVMSRPRTVVALSWRACAMAEGEEPIYASAHPAWAA
eukprot:1159865-Pelagomonas_calceolata.AAC.7